MEHIEVILLLLLLLTDSLERFKRETEQLSLAAIAEERASISCSISYISVLSDLVSR